MGVIRKNFKNGYYELIQWICLSSVFLYACCFYRNRGLYEKYKYDVIMTVGLITAFSIPNTLLQTFSYGFTTEGLTVPDTFCNLLNLFMQIIYFDDVVVLAATSARRAYKIVLEVHATRRFYAILLTVCGIPVVLLCILTKATRTKAFSGWCYPNYVKHDVQKVLAIWYAFLYIVAITGNIVVAAWQYIYGRRADGRKRREELEVSIAFVLYSIAGALNAVPLVIQWWGMSDQRIFSVIRYWSYLVRRFELISNAVVTIVVISDFRMAFVAFVRMVGLRIGVCYERQVPTGIDNVNHDEADTVSVESDIPELFGSD